MKVVVGHHIMCTTGAIAAILLVVLASVEACAYLDVIRNMIVARHVIMCTLLLLSLTPPSWLIGFLLDRKYGWVMMSGVQPDKPWPRR
jgi:hypothetical protein